MSNTTQRLSIGQCASSNVVTSRKVEVIVVIGSSCCGVISFPNFGHNRRDKIAEAARQVDAAKQQAETRAVTAESRIQNS